MSYASLSRYPIAMSAFLSFSVSFTFAQNSVADSVLSGKSLSYFNITFMTGAAYQIGAKRSGPLSFEFPYVVTTTTSVTTHEFSATINTPFRPVKSFYLPVGFEVGTIRHNFRFGGAFELFPHGYTTSDQTIAGYGWNFYVGGDRRYSGILYRKFMIQLVVALNCDVEGGGRRSLQLGQIDNPEEKIDLLGKTCDSIYNVIYSSRSGTYTRKYTSKAIRIGMGQREYSLLPMIIFGNNPFSRLSGEEIYVPYKERKKIRYDKRTWELAVGFNVPLYDEGFIRLTQTDGVSSHNVSLSDVRFTQSDLSVKYKGRLVKSTPYRFPGLYVNLVIHSNAVEAKQ